MFEGQKPYDLNLGYPELSIIPNEILADLSAEIMRDSRGLQYGGDLKGKAFIREAVAEFIQTGTGDPVNISELMISCGSLQGIDIACRSLTNPGDVVAVESPTFFFGLDLLRMSHVELVSVPLVEDGIDLDALQALAEKLGPRLRMLYTIPSYQNPTGICASANNRQKLVALAQKYNFVLLEDTAYHFLYFDSPPPPMLKHYDEGSGHVVTVGTFSKLIAPSLRQGWIRATPQQIDQFTHYKADSSASLLTSEIVSEFLRRGEMPGQLDRLHSFYGRKCARMISAMKEHLPKWATWTAPGGGYFVWVTLPPEVSAQRVREMVTARGADFFPGRFCFAEPVADRFVRLCFAYVNEDAIEQGVTILGQCLHEIHPGK